MELDEESLEGHWSTNSKTGMDFFIINDAIFSKLCILGEDVEPCFEGSSITAPEVSKTFTKMDNEFKATLYTMMQDLKFALEGGQKMDIEKAETMATEVQEPEVVETEPTVEEPVVETSEDNNTAVEENDPIVTEAENAEEMDNENKSVLAENDNSIEVESNQETFAKKDDEENDNKDEDQSDASDEDKKDDDEEDKKDYALLYSELQTAYSDLETKYQALVEFKNEIDNEKKDALINSFYMLSDEDKADVISNKANYSLDEIESKLSVICVRKRVNFDLEDTSKKEEVVENVTTYNMNDVEPTTPAWIAALKNTRNSKK